VETRQEHSRLIAEAAREILVPLGVRRKGHSRSWFDDRGWWLGHVEFQPSSWSRGSYLNVGVMWLWYELPYHVSNVGYRVHDFEAYEDTEQFRRVALTLAQKAAHEIVKYRTKFATIAGCATYFAKQRDAAPSDYMSAGIALGVVGRIHESREWFDADLAVNDNRDWVLEQKQRVRELRDLLDDPPAFLNRVRRSIARTRELLHLSPLTDWPF
jgi:hypothetical protein